MNLELGARVKSELFVRKMTQKELAKMLGISNPYLSDILSGKRNGVKVQEHIKHIKKILDI